MRKVYVSEGYWCRLSKPGMTQMTTDPIGEIIAAKFKKVKSIKNNAWNINEYYARLTNEEFSHMFKNIRGNFLIENETIFGYFFTE